MAAPRNDGDIFDRSFKQIIGSLSPKALIRFINGLFGSNHPPGCEVRRLNTEQLDKNLRKLQPDEIVSVGGRTYLIEEQTTDDANMTIRVFEYGYAQALKEKETKGGIITLPFPRMVVIYLEAGSGTPETLTVRMRFPDGTEHDFNVRTLKLLEYTVEELAERGLAALLPFYIIRLRKAARHAKTEEERREVEEGLRELGMELIKAIERGADEGQLDEADVATLLERLLRLLDYVGQRYKTTEVKKMGNTALMGYGQALALKHERKGARKGRLEGKLEIARSMMAEGESLDKIIKYTGLSAEKIAKL